MSQRIRSRYFLHIVLPARGVGGGGGLGLPYETDGDARRLA